MERETVLILDFGSQYTQLIARRLRELSVYSEILPPGTRAGSLAARRPRGIVLSGGPDSVHQRGAPRCDPRVFQLGVPVVGICYGMLLMSHVLGGEVKRSGHREYGQAVFSPKPGGALLRGLPPRSRVGRSHGDDVMLHPRGPAYLIEELCHHQQTCKIQQKEFSMAISNTRIYPINTGWVQADLGTYMFFKGSGGQKIEIPVICYLVDTGDHKVMVDTGMPDAERATKYHHDSRKADCLDSPDAVAKFGINPDDVDICIFTHLHWDHSHCMKRFKNARYIAHATEIRWAYNPLPLWYRSYESPALGIEAPFGGCQFELVEGEATIVPGVKVFPTPGHTPGSQSVAVETLAGTAVLVGDAIFLYRNFEPKIEEHWRYWVQQRFADRVIPHRPSTGARSSVV